MQNKTSQPKKVAQAQAKDPHIGPVEDRLSLISTNGRNPLIRNCRGRWTWEHVKNAETCGQERTEDEWKAEVELPTGQSQRPVYTSCYVKWILNSLQHKSDHLKMLEDKEPITTLKPKLLKKAGILQGNCSFFQWDKLLRVSANKLIWFLLPEVTVNQEIPSFRKGIV